MKNITIIGAGLGGLSAGALLAKRGHRVHILEQHYMVGGCATNFKRKGGFNCEVGLHEMEGVYTNPKIVEIFEELDVYKNIDFIKADEFFEVRTKNGSFIMPDGIDSAKSALIERFPKEKSAIDKYFGLIKSIRDKLDTLQNMSWYHFALFPFLFSDILYYKSKSVTDVFDKLFQDEELKLILNSNVQYYNDSPKSLSFLLHCVAQYSYHRGGGYFIKGGSGKLSDYLAKVIRDNGGEVTKSALVTKCSLNSVEYVHKKETYSIESDEIISNLSPKQTYELFNEDYIETKPLGSSLLSIYFGFSQNLKSVYGKRAYSNFILDDLNSLDEFEEIAKKDILERGFVFVDYSQLDSNLTKDETKSFGAIAMSDDIKDWEELSPDEYRAKKQKLIEVVTKRLERHYPNISNLIEYAEVGTAKTVKDYIKTPNGTAYGFKPTPKDFFRIPQSKSKKIKNLYFVGQWVIAGGFSPAIISGGLCADVV